MGSEAPGAFALADGREVSGGVIAGHTRESAAEPGYLPRLVGIFRLNLPAGNMIE
jgi:hypothetical protein